MQTDFLISINEFCSNHDIDVSFVGSLEETGLIRTTLMENTVFIDADQLQLLEKFVHMHYDLDINIEGIETVHHLLQKINTLYDEIQDLKNRLRLYETFE